MSRRKASRPRPLESAGAPPPAQRVAPRTLGVSLIVVAVLGALAYAAWSHRSLLRPQAPTTAGSYRGFNVVLVTIDTLRADHLPMYGYTKVETPNLDALAGESFVFRSSISPIPLTLPSHTTMLTSLLPATHGIPDNGTWVVDPKITTLQEILKGQGYATAAFVSSFVLDSRWQLNKGFDAYYDNFYVPDFNLGNPGLLQRKGGDTEIEAERWLDAHPGQPFFAWLHMYDPHQPYTPPEPYRSKYASNLYDGEIAYADSVVGRLREKLRERGVEDRTILVLTSDHGESLGDHREQTHGLLIYESTLHVPFLIRLPRGKRQEVEGIIRHIDLAPTILAWLGVPQPTQFQGKSLIPMMEGTEKDGRVAYSESLFSSLHYGWSALHALTTLRYKLIKAPRPELYDRLADPHETQNLYDAKPAVVHDLMAELEQTMAAAATGDLHHTAKMDPDTEEKLRALGYMSAAFEDPEAGPERLRNIDPKDKVHLHDVLNDASLALMDHKDDLALQLIEPVLREDPDMTEAHYCVGVIAVRKQKYETAIEEFSRVVEARPDHVKALYNLASTYQGIGDYTDAEAYFLRVLQHDRKHMPTIIHLGHLYKQTGQKEKSRERFLEAAGLYEGVIASVHGAAQKSDSHAKLAEVLFKAGEVAKAQASLETAIALEPRKPTLHYNLALILEDRHDIGGAIEAYRKELELAPTNYRASLAMGLLLRDQGRFDEAVAAMQKAISLAPKDPQSYYRLAETYSKAGRQLEEARRHAETALRLAPNFKEAQELLAAITRKLANRAAG